MISYPDHAPWVAVDTETSGLYTDDGARIACVAITYPHPEDLTLTGLHPLQTITLPFDQGVRDKITVTQLRLEDDGRDDPNLGKGDWELLLEWLREQRLVMQHAKFDLTMFRAGTRHWDGIDLSANLEWDTMLASGVLDPLHPRGLDATARRLGLGAQGKEGVEALQGWLVANKFDKHRYDLAPWDLVQQYVGTDTELTAEIYLNQLARLAGETEEWDEDECDRLYEKCQREFELSNTLMKTEWRGIGYDAAASLAGAEVLEQRAAQIALGLPFNPNVKKEVAAYFCDTLKLEAMAYTEKKNEPRIDEQQLREWRKAGVPHAEALDNYNRCKRAVSMWYRGYPEKMGGDGRLRTSFRQGHVKSGRMSVERVQLQAMPKRDKYAEADGTRRAIFEDLPDIRDLVTPAPGRAIWTLDLTQAELRVASIYSGCKEMIRQLKAGEDIHSNTTVEVMEKEPDDPRWREFRDVAKRMTFGGIFRIGAETFQETLAKLADIHWTIEQCETTVRRWRAMYPEFGEMYYKSMRMVERQRWVPLLSGTDYEVKSWFGERDWPNTGWNRVVQGSLAEGFGMLLCGVERRWPGNLVLTVHDSVYLECREDEGDQIAAEVAAWSGEFMTGLFGIEMSMEIDAPGSH